MKMTRKPGASVALRQMVKGLDDAQARVGWFPSAKYETGAPVAGVAYVQEFGSPKKGIPPRPFMRTTAAEKSQDWVKTAGDLTRAAGQGKIAPGDIMTALALAAEGHVRATITKIYDPALSPATVAARKRKLADGGVGAKSSIEKPLVASGLMLASLTSEVDKP